MAAGLGAVAAGVSALAGVGVAEAVGAGSPVPEAAGAEAVLERFAPVLVEGSREGSGAVAVDVVPGVERLPSRADAMAVPDEVSASRAQRGVLYGRVAPAADGGRWLQYWRFHLDNGQDRGILRTGRHEGDWELTQVRLDAAGRPREALYAQHSGAERCPWAAVRVRGGRPVTYVAHGSHASYFRRGVRDRTFPDPNDEADGRGEVVAARVVPVTAGAPSWMRWPGRWGGSVARLPFESSSPRGPAFQPDGRWSDPDGFAARARPCAASRCDAVDECDGRETVLGSVGAAAVGAGVGGWALRRRRRAEHGIRPARDGAGSTP